MFNFDYFVVFAEMRTGSNFLETNINAYEDLTCHGEAFNTHFIGYPNTTNILGVSQEERDQNPKKLLKKVKSAKGLHGFRFFNDHDPRVLDEILHDPRCAKIILIRNPAESYVSWKIAQATGQWKLTNVKHAKAETIQFDPEEFETHLSTLQSFQLRLLKALQKSGQTAFYIAYEDIKDIEVMNGLASFLGVEQTLDALDFSLKKQNPSALSEKVENYHEMEQALSKLDRFNLHQTPHFEPRRGPAVPGYFAAKKSPLLYLPIRGGPEGIIKTWLAKLDDSDVQQLQTGFTQRSLRQWKKQRPGHRSFTVVRHPLNRAHSVFCDRIVNSGEGSFIEIRRNLIRNFSLDLPEEGSQESMSAKQHHDAFLAFLNFLKANLAGQTNVRVDGHWASQTQILQGFSEFAFPDFIFREDRLTTDLTMIANQVGIDKPEPIKSATDPHASRLEAIRSPEIEDAAQNIYQRDYIGFGF